MVVPNPAIATEDLPPAELAWPALVTSASDSSVAETLSGAESNIVSQVQLMFANFAKSIEDRFSSIDDLFSQVISSSSFKLGDTRDNVSGQDAMTNHSFSTPSPLAVRTEHPPDIVWKL